MFSIEYMRLKSDYIKYVLARMPEICIADVYQEGKVRQVVRVRENGGSKRYRTTSKIGKRYSQLLLWEENLKAELALYENKINQPVVHYSFPIDKVEQRFKNGKELWRYLKENADSNTFYPKPPNGPIYKNTVLRSKSELTVALALEKMGFEFVYEPRLIINGRELFPDFAVYVRELEKVIFVEYFGKMDQRGYINTNVNKMCDYADAGLIEGRDIVYIFETQHIGIDPEIFSGKMISAVMANVPSK